jgi:putative glutamine amidotransferase
LIVSKRPLVGVSCCTRQPEDPVQGVAERYLRTAPLMEADFVLVPAMSDIIDIGSIVGRLDGILLTGSPSNLAPNRFAAAKPESAPSILRATRRRCASSMKR